MNKQQEWEKAVKEAADSLPPLTQSQRDRLILELQKEQQ